MLDTFTLNINSLSDDSISPSSFLSDFESRQFLDSICPCLDKYIRNPRPDTIKKLLEYSLQYEE